MSIPVSILIPIPIYIRVYVRIFMLVWIETPRSLSDQTSLASPVLIRHCCHSELLSVTSSGFMNIIRMTYDLSSHFILAPTSPLRPLPTRTRVYIPTPLLPQDLSPSPP